MFTPGTALVLSYAPPRQSQFVMDFDRAYRVFDPFQVRGCLPLYRVAEILSHIGSFV